MTGPRCRRLPAGGLRLEGLAPWLVEMLHEVPELLDGEQPEAVSRRLYPAPSADEDHAKEWERLVHPDLFALLAGAREVLAQDLAHLCPDPDEPGSSRVDLRDDHVAAWLSALNAARLALSERFGIDQADMDGGELVVHDAKSLALARVHMLGWLQEVLIAAEDPDLDADEDLEDELDPDLD